LAAVAVALPPVAIAIAPISAVLPAAFVTPKFTGPVAAGADMKMVPLGGVLMFEFSTAAPLFISPRKHSGEAPAMLQMVTVSLNGDVVSTTLVPE
jgi:hypothetical protein